MRDVLILLQDLTEKLPPPSGRRHSITLPTEKQKAAEPASVLLLSVWVGEEAWPFLLDGSDLKMSGPKVVDYVLGIVEEKRKK